MARVDEAVNRRMFVGAIAGGLLGAAFGVRSQQLPRLARLGHLSIGSTVKAPPPGLVEAWARYGWFEGKNFSVERRFAATPEQLPPLATELAELKVDLILTSGILAALALQKATRTIPVVFNVSDDPVEAGLVASLPRPGGNFTGVYTDNLIVEGKRLELIKEVLPQARLVIYTPNVIHARTEADARTLGMRLRRIAASGAGDLDRVFAELRATRADAVVFAPVTWINRSEVLARIGSECRSMKLPAVGTHRGLANAGGLISFGPIVSDVRIVAKMDQILKGANPGDLPVEMPTDFDLVFNLVTADAIGVKISKALQFRANDNIRPRPG